MNVSFFSPNSYKKEQINLSTSEFKDALDHLLARSEIGFTKLGHNLTFMNEVRLIFNKFPPKKYFIHVGIGGSGLGPSMLISSLGKRPHPQFIFINNIDPDQIAIDLEGINPKDCLFYFVSKSGTTAETMAHLALLTNWCLEKSNGKFSVSEHFIFCTDPKNGDLRTLAQSENIACLEVPPNVGGRFSVLTPVGLLPALYANIDIRDLLDGAKDCVETAKKIDTKNTLFQFISHTLAWKNLGINQTVFMPYSSRLKSFADWFVQLWAESLGKKLNLEGREVFEGLTPVPGYGATDQHSQVQLFMEGPHDKALIIVKLSKFERDFKLSCNFKTPSLEKLKDATLAQLMEAECLGTLQALKKADRPYALIELDRLSAYEVGGLIMYCELATALMGHFLAIDPFNQPGVEAGKIYAFQFLKQLTEKKSR